MRQVSLVAAALLLFACDVRTVDDDKSLGSSSEALDSSAQGAVNESLRHAPSLRWSKADDELIAPTWRGNDDKGTLYLPQWRGASVGIEEYVWAPPSGDCRKLKGTIRVDWDSAENTVRIVAKYRGLPKRPNVRRTEGVDYFSNPFHPFPKDFDNGVYRLWVIQGADPLPATFYYDPGTLNLLGSQFDFPAGPPNGGAVIPVTIPLFTLSGSDSFEPDADGFAVKDYTIPYDNLQVESGDFSVARISFVPFNLCLGQPAAPVRGQARPYVTPWQPTGIGPSFKKLLHSGLAFDIQLENPLDATAAGGNLPYVFGGVAFIGGPSFQGGVPNGYRFSLSNQIQNVSPIIKPVPGGNGLGCFSYVNEPHITATNHCAP
jgi:hypothetical protein